MAPSSLCGNALILKIFQTTLQDYMEDFIKRLVILHFRFFYTFPHYYYTTIYILLNLCQKEFSYLGRMFIFLYIMQYTMGLAKGSGY